MPLFIASEKKCNSCDFASSFKRKCIVYFHYLIIFLKSLNALLELVVLRYFENVSSKYLVT